MPDNIEHSGLSNNSNTDLIEKLAIESGTELWKYIMTNRNIKKQDLLAHHYNIAFNVFRKWFKEIKSSLICVSLGDEEKPLKYNICSGKVEYKSHKQSLINRLCEPDENETQQAIEHLKTGYPALWNIWINAKNMANSLLEEVRDFWNDVEDFLLLELEQRDPKIPVLSEYDASEKPKTNFYLLKDTVINIVHEIYQFIDKAIPDSFFNVIDEGNGNFIVGTHAWVFMRTNDRTMAEKFAKLADDSIHHSEFIRRAKAFNSRKSEIEGSLKNFDETLDYIARDLEQTSKQLEGACRHCKRIMSIL